MSSIQLGDAFERFAALPQAVNWIGEWDQNTVYLKNDVVTSPLTTASFIMIGPQTSLLGGEDPSINNVNWFQYGSSINTVQNIRVGAGLELLGSDSNPIVSNTGVITLVPGDGITNIGTNVDPVLTCETLTAIVPGLGIDVFGIPIPNIVNTGVVNLIQGRGLKIVGSQLIDIDNEGLFSLEGNIGLTVSAGVIKTITNTGLLSVIAGTGIANIGTATEPNLKNNGVVTLRPLNESVLITGTNAGPLIASNLPQKTVVWIPTIATKMTPNPIGGSIPTGIIPVTSPPGLWTNCVANGVPYKTGYFLLTIPFTFMLNTGGFFVRAALRILLADTVNNVTYEIPYYAYNPRLPLQNLIEYSLGNVLISLEVLRFTGFRQLTQIQVISGVPLFLQSIGGPAYATYFRSLSGLA